MPSVELEGVCMGWGCVFFQVFYWHVTHRDRVELLIEHSGCSSAEVLVMGGLKKKKKVQQLDFLLWNRAPRGWRCLNPKQRNTECEAASCRKHEQPT